MSRRPPNLTHPVHVTLYMRKLAQCAHGLSLAPPMSQATQNVLPVMRRIVKTLQGAHPLLTPRERTELKHINRTLRVLRWRELTRERRRWLAETAPGMHARSVARLGPEHAWW